MLSGNCSSNTWLTSSQPCTRMLLFHRWTYTTEKSYIGIIVLPDGELHKVGGGVSVVVHIRFCTCYNICTRVSTTQRSSHLHACIHMLHQRTLFHLPLCHYTIDLTQPTSYEQAWTKTLDDACATSSGVTR